MTSFRQWTRWIPWREWKKYMERSDPAKEEFYSEWDGVQCTFWGPLAKVIYTSSIFTSGIPHSEAPIILPGSISFSKRNLVLSIDFPFSS